jgi:hypothetical protein
VRRVSLLITALLLALTVGCGSDTKSTTAQSPATVSSGTSQTPSSTTCASAGTRKFAKTRFLVNAGLAYGAFNRYILKPYRAGAFQKGANGRVAALAKAGTSAVFVADQLRRAKNNAAADPSLCKLAAPLEKAAVALTGLVSGLKAGSFNPTDLLSADGLLKQIGKDSAGAGATITEK